MSVLTLFNKIVSGDIPSYKVWEDDNYLAFLTPWPNTPGFTVVVPKQNPGDNYLDVSDEAYVGLLQAAKKVGEALRKALGAKRIGLVIEGQAVPHLHVKLIPMHGDSGTHDHEPQFSETYQGFLTTAEGPKMNDEQLSEIQAKIKKASNES